MSLNINGIQPPVPTDVTGSLPSVALTGNTANVQAITNLETNVTVSLPSLSLESITASANQSVAIGPNAATLSIAGQPATIVGESGVVNNDINASVASLGFTTSNTLSAGQSLSVSQNIPNMTLGPGVTHDMDQYITDPHGLVIDSQVLNINPAGATYSHATKLLTGVSLSVPIVGAELEITARLPAFPGAEGFGTETTHGRGGTVHQVTNLNDSGPGSLRAALESSGPRIIIFRVAGTIILESNIALGSAHNNFYLAGKTAPGDGICIRGSNSLEQALLQLGHFSGIDPSGGVSDALIRHVRFRHGSQGTSVASHDNLIITGGTNNVVFDHCSLTWAGDECYSLWNGGNGGPDIYNITFSHCLWGEGIDAGDDNKGVLISGSSLGDSIYNISFHHNLSLHTDYRNYKQDSGSGGSDRGSIFINNVHYNSFGQNYSFGQNQYSGCSAINVDIIADYFKDGPDSIAPAGGIKPVLMSRGASHNPPAGCPGHIPIELHFVDSALRDVNGNDTLTRNDEVNNYNMVFLQFGTETWNIRATEITDQPINPITRQTWQNAYTSIVVNGDVGALPHDSVDARLVSDTVNGNGYSTTNLPGKWGSATWPTLTGTAPTDTSGNGLPDSYQVGVLGKDINDTYNPAATYTLGNGYSDIENWIESL